MQDQAPKTDASVSVQIVDRLRATLNQLRKMNETAENTVVGFHGIEITKEPEKNSDLKSDPNGFIRQINGLLNDIGNELNDLETKLYSLHKIVN